MRAALHISKNSIDLVPTYRMVQDDNTAFIYGEGWIRFKKTQIVDIPSLDLEPYPSVLNLIDYINSNREYFFNYLDQYGFAVIADQLKLTSSNVSTSQAYFLLSHLDKHRNLIDYLTEVKAIHMEVLDIFNQNYDRFSYFMQFKIDDLKAFHQFCRFDWMMGTWGINLLSVSMTEVKNDLFTMLLTAYAELENLGEVSFMNTLEHMKKGFGLRIDKLLTYHSFLEHR